MGTRCEIKNVNSFKFLEKAIDYEARRQIEIIEDGGRVIQETRLYDPDRDETRTMRSKEDAHDYRYFPDPDLLPLVISDDWLARVKASMPELPEALKQRFVSDYALPVYDAAQLASSKALAVFFEATLAGLASPTASAAKLVANWLLGEVSAQLNREEKDIAGCPVSPVQLAGVLKRVTDNTINGKMAKEVLAAMWSGEFADADAVIDARGLKQISDSGAVEAMIDTVLAANQAMVDEYKSGKEKAFNALIGQIMKASKGKADPAQVNALLKAKLA